MEKEHLEYSLKLLAKTSLVVLIGLIISKVLGYTYRIIIARYYGPEVYGLFSLAVIILAWFITLSTLGITDGLIRFIPQYRGSKEKEKIFYLFNLSTKILLVASFISAFFLFSFSDFIAISIFHNPALIDLLKLISFFVPIAVLSNQFLVALRCYEHISSFSLVYNILQNIVRVLTLILFVILGFQASSVVLSYSFGFLFVLIASYLICKYKISELFVKSELSQKDKITVKKSFLSYSFPLLFLGVVSMLFYWTDSFFLGYFKGVESVGLYNAAVPIALLLSIMPELFMQLFFPMINRYYSNKNYELIKQLSKQLGKWIFIVNLPIFILIFVFPGAAINILFGSQYLMAQNALRILIFGSFIISIATISNNLLSMAGKSKLVLFDIMLASIINIVLNTILIPMPSILGMGNSLGINGAAIATALSIIFLNILFFFQAKKHLGIMPLRNKMINIFIIGIITATILFYFRTVFPSQNILLVVLLALGFLAVYAFLILLSKSLDDNDWSIISTIWRKLLPWPKRSKF